MNWKDTLAKVAPTVATALGGPLAGMAINVVAKALGVSPTESSIEKAITTGDPKIFLKLKEADNALKVELKKLDIRELSIDAKDRNSARERESKVGGIATPVLAFVIVTSFFLIIAFILGFGLHVNPEIATMIGMLVGMVSSKAEQVVNYYFGSSAGSRRKNDMIENTVEDAIKKEP